MYEGLVAAGERNGSRFGERFPHRCVYYLPYRGPVVEPYLYLLGVDIHIYLVGVHLEKEKIGGLRSGRNQLLVSLHDGFMKIGALEEPAVHVHVLLAVGLLAGRRLSDETGDFHQRRLGSHFQQIAGGVLSDKTHDSLLESRRMERVHRSILPVKRERHLRMTHGHPPELFGDMTRFGRTLVQSPASGRYVEEEIFHRELAPDRRHDILLRLEAASFDDQLRAELVLRPARSQLHMRDGRDGGQRLAAEP